MTCRTPSATVPSSDLATSSRSRGPCVWTTRRDSPSTNLSQRGPSSKATLARQRRATLMHRRRQGLSDVQSTWPSHSAHSLSVVNSRWQPVDVIQCSVTAVTVPDASVSASSMAWLATIARVTTSANCWSTPSNGFNTRLRHSVRRQWTCLTSTSALRLSTAAVDIPSTWRRTTSENSSSKNRLVLMWMSTWREPSSVALRSS